MKIQNLLVLLIMFFPTVYAEGRTWKDVRGNTLEAAYVGRSTDPGKVILELPDGKRKVFLISQFSEEDKQYIQKKAQKRKSSESTPQIAERKPKETSDLPKPKADLGTMKETASGGVRVVVEGYGETIKEAKQDAMRTAVEQVVGMLVDAQTRTECDEVIEKILTATGAYVESNKVLNASVKDGVCTVQLEAVVVKNAISNKLQSVNRGSSMKIDGGALLDKVDSKVQSEKDGVMFLANFLKEEQFPYSLIDVTFDGKPNMEQANGLYMYKCNWTYQVNMKRYKEFIKKLVVILDKVATSKTTFMVDLNIYRGDILRLSYNDFSEEDTSGSGYLYVCTDIQGITTKKLLVTKYKLPLKYCYIWKLYNCIVPSVELNVLDSSKESLGSDTFSMHDGAKHKNEDIRWIEAFNLANSPDDDPYYHEKISSGSSSGFAKHDSGYIPSNYIPSIFVIPFAKIYQQGDLICEKFEHETTIELNAEDVKKINSVEIHVIADNPAMDEIYKNLESEIDKITTK